MNGTSEASEVVTLRKIRLPDFNNNLQVDEIKALVFNTKTRYDIILGSDFLLKDGININYVERNLSWFGNSIPLRDPFDMTDEEYLAMADASEVQNE